MNRKDFFKSAAIIAEASVMQNKPTKKVILKKVWTLEGSNDGVNWTMLATQTNFPKFPQRKYKITFLMSNRTEYTHYRLNITAQHDPNHHILQLADWILYYNRGQ